MLKLTKTVHLLHLEEEANQILSCFKPLIQYIRDKNNRKVGVLLGYKDADGELMIGWSKCNIKRDKFNRDLAITKAFSRRELNAGKWADGLPQSLRETYQSFCDRCVRFFYKNGMVD